MPGAVPPPDPAFQNLGLVEPRQPAKRFPGLGQGVPQPALVEGQDRLRPLGAIGVQAGAGPQVAAGRLTQGAHDFIPAGLPLLLALSLVERLLLAEIDLSQGAPQSEGDLGCPVVHVPGALQVLPGAIEVMQRQVAASQRRVARAGGHPASSAHFPLDGLHGPAHHGLGWSDVVDVQRLGPPQHPFHLLHPLAEPLRQLRLLGGIAARLPPEGEQYGRRHQGDSRHGRHGLVLAQALADAFRQTRRAGLDRLAVEEPVQFVGERPRRIVAPAGIFLQALHDHALEVHGHGRRVQPQRVRFLVDGLQERLDGRGRLERGMPGQQGVERGAQAVDVRAAVHRPRLAQGLLRRHEGRRPQGGSAHRERFAAHFPDQAEIHHEGGQRPALVRLHHDVGRLDVPVDEAHPVGGVDRLGRLSDDQHLLLQRHFRGGGAQGPALDELHGDVGPAVHLAHLVHFAHVGMVDAGLGPRLAEEALHAFGIVTGQELDRHPAVQPVVPGQVHAAHAAHPEEAFAAVQGPTRRGPAGFLGGGFGRRGGAAGARSRGQRRRRQRVFRVAVWRRGSGSARQDDGLGPLIRVRGRTVCVPMAGIGSHDPILSARRAAIKEELAGDR